MTLHKLITKLFNRSYYNEVNKCYSDLNCRYQKALDIFMSRHNLNHKEIDFEVKEYIYGYRSVILQIDEKLKQKIKDEEYAQLVKTYGENLCGYKVKHPNQTIDHYLKYKLEVYLCKKRRDEVQQLEKTCKVAFENYLSLNNIEYADDIDIIERIYNDRHEIIHMQRVFDQKQKLKEFATKCRVDNPEGYTLLTEEKKEILNDEDIVKYEKRIKELQFLHSKVMSYQDRNRAAFDGYLKQRQISPGKLDTKHMLVLIKEIDLIAKHVRNYELAVMFKIECTNKYKDGLNAFLNENGENDDVIYLYKHADTLKKYQEIIDKFNKLKETHEAEIKRYLNTKNLKQIDFNRKRTVIEDWMYIEKHECICKYRLENKKGCQLFEDEEGHPLSDKEIYQNQYQIEKLQFLYSRVKYYHDNYQEAFAEYLKQKGWSVNELTITQTRILISELDLLAKYAVGFKQKQSFSTSLDEKTKEYKEVLEKYGLNIASLILKSTPPDITDNTPQKEKLKKQLIAYSHIEWYEPIKGCLAIDDKIRRNNLYTLLGVTSDPASKEFKKAFDHQQPIPNLLDLAIKWKQTKCKNNIHDLVYEHKEDLIIYFKEQKGYEVGPPSGSALYQYIANHFTDINKYIGAADIITEAQKLMENYSDGYELITKEQGGLKGCKSYKDYKQVVKNADKIKAADIIAKRQIREKLLDERMNKLLPCTSEWPIPIFEIKIFSLYYYYPTTCEFDVEDKDWDIRYLIWNFKNNPEKTISVEHDKAMKEVITKVSRVITYFFKDQVKNITLVCIPASTIQVNELRYREFSSILCEKTGMDNAFDHVKIITEKRPKHLGFSDIAKYEFDKDYFSGRCVLLFDDVITKGKSMLRMYGHMKVLGAQVVGGITIGKTTHTYQKQHPIDSIYN